MNDTKGNVELHRHYEIFTVIWYFNVLSIFTPSLIHLSPPKDEKGLKEWVRSKLKALASLLGKLGMKAAEALPGIIGGIISWILNRAKGVVGWVSQNLWALVVGIGGLIYTYMVTRK